MRSILGVAPLLLGLGVLLSAGGCGRHSAQNDLSVSGLPVWTASPAVSSSLAPEVTMGDYAIRPPMGYTLKQAPIQQGEGRGMAYEWVGVSHADGNRPLLHIEIMFREGQWIPGATPNMEETAALQDVSGKDVSVVQSPIENGAVNGIPFARAYWHGIGS